MTRLEARTLIRKELGESTSAFWSDEELNTWINLAGHDIASKSMCIKDKGFFTTVEDVAAYSMPTLFPGFLAPLDLYFYQDASTWQRLERKNFEDMNLEYPGWKSAESGTPFLYIFEPERGKTLTLYVKPDATNAGTNYGEIYYAKDFTDITADGQSLATQLLPVLELALVDFVVATGFETRGLGDKANDKWRKYGARLEQYRIDLLKQTDEDQPVIMKNYRNF